MSNHIASFHYKDSTTLISLLLYDHSTYQRASSKRAFQTFCLSCLSPLDSIQGNIQNHMIRGLPKSRFPRGLYLISCWYYNLSSSTQFLVEPLTPTILLNSNSLYPHVVICQPTSKNHLYWLASNRSDPKRLVGQNFKGNMCINSPSVRNSG